MGRCGTASTCGPNRWVRMLLPPETDLHHLFAEDPSLNSSRGNSVFNEVYPNHTNAGYGNYWTSTQFEVRDPQKAMSREPLFYVAHRSHEWNGGRRQTSVLSNTTSPSYGPDRGSLGADPVASISIRPTLGSKKNEATRFTLPLPASSGIPLLIIPRLCIVIWGPVAIMGTR